EAVGLRVPVVLVFSRLRNDVALALRPALAGKGIGEALHAVRLGLLGLRLRLTGLRDCLGADHIFGAAERQEIAELRRIDHRLRVETNQLAVVQSQAENGRDASSVRSDADR